MTGTFLGIDVGTTRTKAVVLRSGSSEIVGAAATPTPQAEADGVPVHVPAAIRSAVVDVARRALAEAGPDVRAHLGGIAVTSVGEEAVLLDATARPVGDVPTWFSGVGHGPAAEHACEGEHQPQIQERKDNLRPAVVNIAE